MELKIIQRDYSIYHNIKEGMPLMRTYLVLHYKDISDTCDMFADIWLLFSIVVALRVSILLNHLPQFNLF